ncbi:hypothetical protein BD413DRAFT_487163 [Trametes elegans]|nr:hypothetical protein BD413DRAFT_487163 [Trametes elegans]
MFAKTALAAAVFLGLSLQVSAHAGITPALGVSGTFIRANVQRPSAATPCGTVNIAANINNSTAIPLNPDGTFDATITDFNAGLDGSREIATVSVDPTATGNSFTTGPTVLTNGDRVPTAVGSQPLVVQLPSGLACTGGTAGDLCLVSFITAGNFGNCVVVQQASA